MYIPYSKRQPKLPANTQLTYVVYCSAKKLLFVMNDKGTTDEYTQQIKVISRINFGSKKNFINQGRNKKYVIRYAIWYHLYYLQNVKNTHGGVLPLVKLQLQACNFTKSNTPPWVFLRFLFKLCKWHLITQSVSYLKAKIEQL